MEILRYLFPNTVSLSYSSDSIESYEEDPPVLCALRILKDIPSLTSSSMVDRAISATPSETVVHFLSEKVKTRQPYTNFTAEPYLTFEDLQSFKADTKEKMQDRYLSIIKRLKTT